MFIEKNYNSVVPKMNTVNKSHMETGLYTKKYLLVTDLHVREGICRKFGPCMGFYLQ